MKRWRRALIGVALASLTCMGVGVALTWAPDRPLADLRGRWAPAPSQFMPLAGMQVHWRDEGPRDDPVPIVLLHGTSASLHTWDGWTDALKRERRVIRMDMPGFGLTGPAPDGRYAMADYVRFVVTLLDQLGIQRCVLAGNSLGGHVAWETALAQPQRVERLVLVDAAGYPLQSTSVPIGFRLARIPALRPLLQNTLPRSLIESSVRNVYGDPSRVSRELVDRYYELTLREGNRAALAQRFMQMGEPGAGADRIRQLKLPTLILWGAQDRLIAPVNAQRFAQDITGSRVVMFDHLGHVPHEEDPAATVQPVRQFLGLR